MKVRNVLSAKDQARLLTMRNAILVSPHIKGKSGNAAYAAARKAIKENGIKVKNLRRVVELAQGLDDVKCG